MVIDSFRGTEMLRRFDIFARAYQLRKVWKLDPALMLELNRRFGPVNFTDANDPNSRLPLDWRHPDCHAIYWAVKGLRVAGKKTAGTQGKKQYPPDEINTDRILAHSLQNLFRNGRIFIYTETAKSPSDSVMDRQQQPRQVQQIFLRPDLRMFDSYNQQIMRIIEKYDDPNSKTESSHKIGHRNMLQNAVFSFYQAGHVHKAGLIYMQLRKLYPRDDFKVPLVNFVRNVLQNELRNLQINDAKEMIEMMLRESYFRYAMRDDDEAFGREKMAQQVYDYYRSLYKDENRIDLPDFKLLKYLAMLDFCNDNQYSPTLRQSLLGRISVERPELAEQLKSEEQKIQQQLKQSQ